MSTAATDLTRLNTRLIELSDRWSIYARRSGEDDPRVRRFHHRLSRVQRTLAILRDKEARRVPN